MYSSANTEPMSHIAAISTAKMQPSVSTCSTRERVGVMFSSSAVVPRAIHSPATSTSSSASAPQFSFARRARSSFAAGRHQTASPASAGKKTARIIKAVTVLSSLYTL